MKYDYCPLYNLKSKKILKHILHIQNKNMLKQNYIASLVTPYISTDGKPRLIEPPCHELKIIQTRIKKMLNKIKVPKYVFSGIKGRSYVDNALIHLGEHLRNLFKTDLTAFFPSIKREAVYRFFYYDLQCSPDIAQILTNLTTIDISKSSARDINSIFAFLKTKQVSTYNHLITGAPTSQILSYLVNRDMFDELKTISNENNIIMTVYVDDITFSSECSISKFFRDKVEQIIRKYGYRISKNKVKSYSKLYPKLITGVVIDSKGNLTVKNSLRKKIVDEHQHLKENPGDTNSKRRLRGLLTAARQIDRNIYPAIHKFAFNEDE